MPELKLSVAVASFHLALRDALSAAAEVGARAVELDARSELAPGTITQTGVRQLRKLLADLNLRVSSVAFPTRRGYYALDQLDARVAATKKVLEFAHELGADYVVNRIGRVPAEGSEERRILIEVLQDIASHSLRAGAWLAAETGTEAGQELAALLDQLPEGAVRADLNVGQLLLQGQSPLEAARALGSRIALVHATDARPDPVAARGELVPLGEGSADFPTLLGALAESDYQGWFVLRQPMALAPVEELRQAKRYLQKL